MPTPSLLIVPARFKSGKLYSQLPTSGAGDFTVTRATTATRVNASGLIESVASGIPRLDYSSSDGTVGCPALLVEPSGTNVNLYSQDFANAWWTFFNASGSVSASTSPDGTNNATKLIEDNNNGFHSIFRGSPLTVTSGQPLTRSVFAKADGRNFISLLIQDSGNHRAFFNLQSGTIGTITSGITGRIENYGNGWYRCSITRTMATTSAASLAIELASADNTGSYQGNGTSGVFIWGAQLETGSVPTSYIPTTTGSVTRNADVVSVSGAVSGSIGQLSGTIYAEVDVRVLGDGRFATLSDGTSNNRIQCRFNAALNGLDFLVVVSASSVGFSISNSSHPSFPATIPAGTYKIALGYKQNDYVVAMNGVTYTPTVTTRNVPLSFSKVTLGADVSDLNQFNNRILDAELYTTRLTNAELQALTA